MNVSMIYVNVTFDIFYLFTILFTYMSPVDPDLVCNMVEGKNLPSTFGKK